MTTRSLRPLERRVRNLARSGVSEDEIAWRFRRSPGFIRRVARLSHLAPTATAPDARSPGELRPVERAVKRSRARGMSHAEIAARFRRSPQWVRRVERFADYKTDLV